MRLAITGGPGFIGTAVIQLALAGGHQVTTLERDVNDSRLPSHERLRRFPWDLADAREVGEALEGIDLLLHVAAMIPPRLDDPSFAESCFHLNAIATRSLVAAAAPRGIKHVVLTSGGSLYANMGRPAVENDAVFPATHAPYYLTSKLAAEIFATAECRRLGIGLTILRIASPYGPGMGPGSAVARFVSAAARGESMQISRGGHTADFVHVDDVARAVLASAEYRPNAIINVGSGEATSIRQLASLVRELAGSVAEIADADPLSPEGGFPPLDIGRARQLLQWVPRDLSQGLRDMLEHAKRLNLTDLR